MLFPVWAQLYAPLMKYWERASSLFSFFKLLIGARLFSCKSANSVSGEVFMKSVLVGKKEKGSWVSVVDGVAVNIININKDITRRTRTIRRIFCGFILGGGCFCFI